MPPADGSSDGIRGLVRNHHDIGADQHRPAAQGILKGHGLGAQV